MSEPSNRGDRSTVPGTDDPLPPEYLGAQPDELALFAIARRPGSLVDLAKIKGPGLSPEAHSFDLDQLGPLERDEGPAYGSEENESLFLPLSARAQNSRSAGPTDQSNQLHRMIYDEAQGAPGRGEIASPPAAAKVICWAIASDQLLEKLKPLFGPARLIFPVGGSGKN